MVHWMAMPARGDEDLDLVLAAREGDDAAFGALFDRWFDRVFDVSYRILRNRDLAAETAQDVFLVAWQQLADLREPGSFGGWLLRMSRNRSLNRLDRERRSVALGDEETGAVIDLRHATLDDTDLVDDAEQSELLWAAAAALGERDASVLDLHLRHGFAAPEIAEALDVSTANAYQLLHRLKDRLGSAIRGWVLWHHGSPACEVLASVLAEAGIDAFGGATVRVISRHARGCDDCEARQVTRLSPDAMFAAVPIVAVGPFLKGRAAAALEAEGVPMSGSAALGGSASGPGRLWARRGVRTGAFLVAAAIVVFGAVAALAGSLGDGTGDVAAPITTTTEESADSTTSSLADPTTTTGSESTATSTDTTPTTRVTDPDPPPPNGPQVLVPPSAVTTTTLRVATPPPPPPAAEPVIQQFTAELLGLGTRGCETFEEGVALAWSTTDTDSVVVSWSDGRTRGPLRPIGTADDCVMAGTAPPTYTLVAVGPGGTASAQATP